MVNSRAVVLPLERTPAPYLTPYDWEKPARIPVKFLKIYSFGKSLLNFIHKRIFQYVLKRGCNCTNINDAPVSKASFKSDDIGT